MQLERDILGIPDLSIDQFVGPDTTIIEAILFRAQPFLD